MLLKIEGGDEGLFAFSRLPENSKEAGDVNRVRGFRGNIAVRGTDNFVHMPGVRKELKGVRDSLASAYKASNRDVAHVPVLQDDVTLAVAPFR